MKNLNSIKPVNEHDDFCLEVHLTEMCNYSCSYCNLHPMIPHKSIDYDNLFSLDYPNNARVFLMGGEPTIDKHFFDVIKEFYKRDLHCIDVQTNLTFKPEEMVSNLKKDDLHVKFYASFHMEYSDVKRFITKCKYLQKYDMYGGIHLMWIRDQSSKCLSYFNILSRLFDNVSLEPTLPKTFNLDEWDKKEELRAFVDQGLLKHCHRLRPEIEVNNTVMTIGDALYNNYERGLKGIKCYIPSHGVTFSVRRNKFYYCCFDLVADHSFDPQMFKGGFCICKNQVCCADIEYRKESISSENN